MNTKDYWEKRYEDGSNSGYGSYGEQLRKKLDWIRPLEVKSISEVGCGDFNFGKRILEMFPRASYWGTDISEWIVKRNQVLFPYATFTNDKDIPPADLVLCVDVLFHILEDDEVEKLFQRLDKAWTKYLVLTAYERDQIEGLSPHIRIRKLDPSRFGTPIIREIVEEDGSLYFYIFKRD